MQLGHLTQGACDNCYSDFYGNLGPCECGGNIEPMFLGQYTEVVLIGNYCPISVLEDIRYSELRYNLEHADKYRAYRKGSNGLDNFLKKISCCGVFESSTKANGETWIIGCNYGH